jgi:hypothetical protein
VVAVKEGEMYVTLPPPLTRLPADDASYQLIVASVGTVALKVTSPAPQRELALGAVGLAGRGFIVPVTAKRVDDTHPVDKFRAAA